MVEGIEQTGQEGYRQRHQDGSIWLAFGYARGTQDGPRALGSQVPTGQTYRPNPVYGAR